MHSHSSGGELCPPFSSEGRINMICSAGHVSTKATTFPQIKEISEVFDVDLHWAVAKRIVFLKSCIKDEEKEIANYQNSPGYHSENSITKAFVSHMIDRYSQEFARLKRELERLRIAESGKFKNKSPGKIDEEMILQAKETLIETVVDFDCNGKSMAFCHPDKHPSLHWNREANRAHCFPCGKSFNAIDVLIDRDGFTFIDAVKQLTGS